MHNRNDIPSSVFGGMKQFGQCRCNFDMCECVCSPFCFPHPVLCFFTCGKTIGEGRVRGSDSANKGLYATKSPAAREIPPSPVGQRKGCVMRKCERTLKRNEKQGHHRSQHHAGKTTAWKAGTGPSGGAQNNGCVGKPPG